jgi:hypothetical protein
MNFEETGINENRGREKSSKRVLSGAPIFDINNQRP